MKGLIVSLITLFIVAFVACRPSDSDAKERPPRPERVNPVGRPAQGVPRPPEEALAERVANAKAARDMYSNMTFAQFKATVFREPEAYGGKYLVNGDTPILNDKQLEEFFENEVKRDPETRGMRTFNQLVINRSGGQDDVWNGTIQRWLTYCVSHDFGNRYDQVKSAMEDAAKAWEQAANVDFIHDPAEDNSCTASNADIVFDVRPVDVNGNYLARAFFPNEPRAARNVLIDESAFNVTGNLTLIGILRHELGHALGFRHEHTRPEAGACFEDANWRPVTDYDAFSVMHYPQCNGQGDWSLTLTHLDQNGAACVYGPASGFTIDPTVGVQDCRGTNSSPCVPRTQVFRDQVAKGDEKILSAFPVTAGTTIEAVMTGTGDPDLYVRFGRAPTRSSYDCRPYLNGANETCSLDVPSDEDEAFVMVRGFTAGNYKVTVTYVSSSL